MPISGKISVLKDALDNNIFPETTSQAIYMDNGKTLEDLTEEVIFFGENRDVIDLQKPEIVEKVNNMNTELNQVSSQMEQKANLNDVAKISSGTHLFASSVSDMTDISKNYMNTTDGYLYIYNSGAWNKTTVQYQSSGIADNSVTLSKRTIDLAGDIVEVKRAKVSLVDSEENQVIEFEKINVKPRRIIKL